MVQHYPWSKFYSLLFRFISIHVATFRLPIIHVVCPSSPTPPCLQFWILTIGSNFSWVFYSSQTNKVYSVCMGKANYNSWNRGKCKLKSRIKLNCNTQACACIWYSWNSWSLNRFCCWWLPLTLFEFSSYYSHLWSSYTCSSSCWHYLFLFFMGYPCKKSLSLIYKHLLLLMFLFRSLHLRRKRIFLLCSL